MTTVIVALVAAAAAAVIGARPASAQVTFQGAPQLAFSYTDSRANDSNFTNTDPAFDVPVGAWLDDAGEKHKSRLFATFDLSGFAGKHIVSTVLRVRDDKTTDCAVRSLEVWETEVPATPPTWQLSPAHVGLLGTIGATPCPGVVSIDVSDRVRAAVVAGQQTLAVEIRVADAAEPGEGDPLAGRRLSWFAGVQLTVGYNTPPVVDTAHLYNGFRLCETDAPGPALGGTGAVQIGAVFNDADANPGILTGEFVIWPVDSPDQRTTMTRTVFGRSTFSSVTVPAGVVVDGGTYAWQVRVTDGTDTSPWSQTCIFSFDGTRPSAPPVVTSANYPANTFSRGGAAPTFTFSPNGVDDVAAYQYSFDILSVPSVRIGPNGAPMWTDPFDQEQFVRAGPDGSVTVTIPFEPPSSVFNLRVSSFDDAYNASPVTTYTFFVQPTAPQVEPISEVGPDRPVMVKITPHSSVAEASDVIEYTVWVGTEEPQTVVAEPDGTATATVVLPGFGSHVVNARSHSANGFLSMPGSWFVVIANDPTVTSDVYPEGATGGGVGVPGDFTFHPGPHGASSYVYSLNFGEESTVAAGPDGTATVTLTPTTGGIQILAVRAVDDAGRESADTFYFFDVAVPTVSVTSDVYPEWGVGGGVGVEGVFTVQGPPGTAGVVYSFDFGPETTVEAAADGSASFTYTPELNDFQTLIVYAVDAPGTPITEPYFYNFIVG